MLDIIGDMPFANMSTATNMHTCALLAEPQRCHMITIALLPVVSEDVYMLQKHRM